MRISFKRIITCMCALALVLILSSCSVFLDFNNSNANDWVSQTISVSLDKQLIFADTKPLVQGQPLVEQVVFNADDNTQPLSRMEAAEKVKRSVVKVDVHTPTKNGSASGVIVDITGGLGANEYYVLTCHHVISSGGDVRVCVPDDNARNDGDVDYDTNYMFVGVIGDKNPAENKTSVSLIGGDRDSDIAVLKLSVGDRKNKNGEPISIVKSKVAPSSYQYNYAEEVFAIGNPSGKLPMTYLSGFISYINRRVKLSPVGYLTLLQHECMITHGSSGGALYNMQGQLIGITNAGNDEYKGMNYAIPFSGEKGFIEVATKLITTNTENNFGYVEGRWNFGITVKETQMEVNGSKVVIDYVDLGSNVDGLLEKGDYITGVKCVKQGYTEFNYATKTEKEFEEVVYLLREYVTVGDTIEITIARRSEEI